jgi:hypothetical protein
VRVPTQIFNTKRDFLIMSQYGVRTLPFFIKPLAEDQLIAHLELVIVITLCEHDLVEHALIDPKACKFGNVVGIDLTLPIV